MLKKIFFNGSILLCIIKKSITLIFFLRQYVFLLSIDYIYDAYDDKTSLEAPFCSIAEKMITLILFLQFLLSGNPPGSTQIWRESSTVTAARRITSPSEKYKYIYVSCLLLLHLLSSVSIYHSTFCPYVTG